MGLSGQASRGLLANVSMPMFGFRERSAERTERLICLSAGQQGQHLDDVIRLESDFG